MYVIFVCRQKHLPFANSHQIFLSVFFSLVTYFHSFVLDFKKVFTISPQLENAMLTFSFLILNNSVSFFPTQSFPFKICHSFTISVKYLFILTRSLSTTLLSVSSLSLTHPLYFLTQTLFHSNNFHFFFTINLLPVIQTHFFLLCYGIEKDRQPLSLSLIGKKI